MKPFEHPGSSAGPPRLPDPTACIRAPGLPEPRPPAGATLPKAFPAALIGHGGERAGNISPGRAGSERDFSRADEESPVLSASQAAPVIADARRRQGSRV